MRRMSMVLAAVALLATACADDGGTGGSEGPSITVASFNFAESQILAEIYAQAMEAEGFAVERKLDLGAREVIFPSLESGEIDFLPEYIGSALSTGFNVEKAYTDPGEGHAELTRRFAEIGVTVLDFAPGEDTNVFVVTGEYATDNDLSTVSDLADVSGAKLGAPPECEERDTCLKGLQSVYGLDDLGFEVIQEFGPRVAALESGDIQVALMFSTQPVIAEKGWVALDDDKGMIPSENIVPVVSDEVVDAYGEDLTSLIDSVTAQITTEVLLDLNGKVEQGGEDPSDVAAAWLDAEGFVE